MPTYKNRTDFFQENNIQYIDYKNVKLLKKFISKHNKIIPRYYTGTSLKNQKMVTKAIKNARTVGLLPFTK